MTELEYDILDELYFVQSFDYLLGSLDLDEDILKKMLKSMFIKGWIRCYVTPSEEVFYGDVDLDSEYGHYYYTASKPGLHAHNLDD
ncbi:hypothetical protein ACFLU5_03835 [Bacteroidota bacterium]